MKNVKTPLVTLLLLILAFNVNTVQAQNPETPEDMARQYLWAILMEDWELAGSFLSKTVQPPDMGLVKRVWKKDRKSLLESLEELGANENLTKSMAFWAIGLSNIRIQWYSPAYGIVDMGWQSDTPLKTVLITAENGVWRVLPRIDLP